MDAVSCVQQYLCERDSNRLVDALISGMYNRAIIVYRIPSLSEPNPDEFLLCWRTSAVLSANIGVKPGEKFCAANSQLSKLYLDASMIFVSRHNRKRSGASGDGVNTPAEQHFESRKAMYRRAGLGLRGGGSSKMADDNVAYRYQLSSWSLEKLLAEDGSPPDERTARFILAVLDAAGEQESSPSPSSSRTSSMISEKPSPLNDSMSQEPEMEPSSSLYSQLSCDSPASPQKTSPSWYPQSSPFSPMDSSAVTGSNFSGSPAMSRAYSFELPSPSSSESPAFISSPADLSRPAPSMEVNDPCHGFVERLIDSFFDNRCDDRRGTKRISAGPEPERKRPLGHPQIQAALLPNWGELYLGDLCFDDVEM